MAGGIVMVIVLVVVMPVGILLSGAVLAGVLGSMLKRDGDVRAEGTELLAVSEKDFTAR